MISYKTIVQQIEKHTIQARQAHGEQQIREQLTAIRALCEVVLNEGNAAEPTLTVHPVAQTQVHSSHQGSSMLSAQPIHVPAQKLNEADANGESLFDF